MSRALPSNPLPRWTTIGFTGHRAINHPDAVIQAIKLAINRIAAMHPRVAGLSSAASGGDTLFAEEMSRRNYPFAIILPFPCERFQQDFADNPAAWERAKVLIGAAANVEILPQLTPDPTAAVPCAVPTDRQHRTPEQKEADNAAYMDAGYRTIDRADVVIAVWNGKPGPFAGTSSAVDYARALGKPMLIIDSETGTILEERIAQLSKTDSEDDPFDEREDGTVGEPIDRPRELVDKYFKAVNSQAKVHAPKARVLVRICLQIFLLSSAFGFANLLFKPAGFAHLVLSVLPSTTLGAGLVIMFFFGRSHDRWLSFRVKAEVCRSFLATWDIRRHATAGRQPRPPIPGLKKLFNDLRLMRQLDHSPPVGLDEAKSKYASDRVESQVKYFERELGRARKGLTRRKTAIRVCTVLAVILEATVVKFSAEHEGLLIRSIDFVGMILPLFATAMGLELVTQETVRRAARYAEMLDALKLLHLRLLASNTWDAIERVATDVEEELFQELIEWRSFVRFTRDIAHPG